MQSLKPKQEKEDPCNTNSDGVKIKTESDDGQVKQTEDSTALKNALLGPQTNEGESTVGAAESGSATHSTKTENLSSGKIA